MNIAIAIIRLKQDLTTDVMAFRNTLCFVQATKTIRIDSINFAPDCEPIRPLHQARIRTQIEQAIQWRRCGIAQTRLPLQQWMQRKAAFE